MTDPLYDLRNVLVRYGHRPVLDVDRLEIRQRGISAVIGANGAGKSTLLRVLAFLLRPTSGVIEFRGRSVEAREAALACLRREVTFVSQSPVLFDRSVAANVSYGLRVRGAMPAGRVEAALEQVGLAGLGDRPARKLSGGETQRVAIARALAVDPSVYLFDEPTANIDREWVPLIENLLQSLGRAGKTVVLATHDITQAYRLSESLIALDEGRVTAAPLLNVLDGVTAHVDGRSYFQDGHLRIELPDHLAPHTVTISADDVIISRVPLESSARNCFAGRITQIAHDPRGIVLTVDCGRPIKARITQHSFDELALAEGSPVFASFKASAISGR